MIIIFSLDQVSQEIAALATRLEARMASLENSHQMRMSALENSQDMLFRRIDSKQEYFNSCLNFLVTNCHRDIAESSTSGFSESTTPTHRYFNPFRPRASSAPPVPRVMLPPQTFSWRSRSPVSKYTSPVCSVICSEPISPVSSFIEPIEDDVVSLLSSIDDFPIGGVPLVTAVDQLQPSLDSTDNLRDIFSTPGSLPLHYTPEISSSGGCLPSDYTANSSSGGCLPSHYIAKTSSGGCHPSHSLPGVTNTSGGGCLSTSSTIGGGTGEYEANNMSSVPNLGNETSGCHPSPSKFKTAHEIVTKYSKFMNDVQVTRVVVALCEHTFFGVDVMKRSTLRGIKGPGLDPTILLQIKGIIRNRFTSRSDQEFEVIWSRCESAIAHRCKKLRQLNVAI